MTVRPEVGPAKQARVRYTIKKSGRTLGDYFARTKLVSGAQFSPPAAEEDMSDS